jgi:hypothetical protein
MNWRPTPGSPADIRYQERRRRETVIAREHLAAIRRRLRGEDVTEPAPPEPEPTRTDEELEERF